MRTAENQLISSHRRYMQTSEQLVDGGCRGDRRVGNA
jgi:hypothetical protein